MDAKQTAKRAGLYLLVAILGFVLGAVALGVIKVRSGPDLELWHTEELPAEFTTRRAEEVPDFEAYLDNWKMSSSPSSTSGSTLTLAPDRPMPSSAIAPVAPPTRDAGRSTGIAASSCPPSTPSGGVLLLHGMSDSPYSLRALGEELHQQGYWVVGLRLPGHGTLPPA